MSRMTKFLRQRCSVEICQRDADGNPMLNDYGENLYQPAQEVKCRHENSVRDVQTSNGSILRSTSRYYLDEAVQIAADDKIDGKVVVISTQYINAIGAIEGYEVYV